jgi:hypothetical protein
MAEKVAVLIKYKYLEYIDSANLSDAEGMELIRKIVKYDQTDETPQFGNPVLAGIFAVIKIDLDSNKKRYNEVSEEKKIAGKKGAEKRWGKTSIAEMANAINYSKNSKCHENMANIANDGKNGKTQKTMAKMHDLDSDSEFDLESGGGDLDPSSEKSAESKKPPPLSFSQIKNKIAADTGFLFDDDREFGKLMSVTDSSWFDEPHSLIAYVMSKIRKGYGDKPPDDQRKLFRKLLFFSPDVLETYPAWKAEQERAARTARHKAEREQAIRKARDSPPKKCRCGGEFVSAAGNLVCQKCGGRTIFDEAVPGFVFYPPYAESLSESLSKMLKRKSAMIHDPGG